MIRCSFSSSALLLCACLTAPGFSQSQPAPQEKPVAAASAYDYSREAVIYDKLSTVYDFNADGTGEKTVTVAARIQSDAAVHQLGVIDIPYAAQNERPEVVYVRVRKKDGSVVQTPPADAQDMPSPVSRIAPFYSDLKEKQIPVKSLSAGDTLEYQVNLHIEKAQALNQFWGAENFITTAVVLEQTVELHLPKGKYIQVVSPKSQPAITEENEKKVYRWRTSHPEPAPVKDEKKNDQTAAQKPDPDDQPAIAWTTFKSWREVGEWYGGLAKDRTAATPELKAKVSELVKDKTTDDEKIRAIYNYVSTQVRYIGVAFGIGRYQPHAAETVMDNQYGDCKDKHTLLAALLQAAGYEAWPALISDSTKPNPDLPSPGQFNHVITVVPRGKEMIWLDSTPEIGPYRMLLFALRDKQALVIPGSGPAALIRTPADPPFPAVDTLTARGKLDNQGTLLGNISLSLRGDDELLYREIFHQASRTQWNDLAQNLSYQSGFAGTISNLDVSVPEQTAEPFHYSYDYTRKEYADWADRRILPLIPAFGFPSAKDEDKPATEVALGAPHTETYHSVIELPANYTAVLPKSVQYSTGFATYQMDYKLDGNRFIAERRVVILESKVQVSKWDEYQKFVKNVQEDEGQFIQLVGAGTPAEASEKNDPLAAEELQQAYAAFRGHDFEASRKAVDRAIKMNPQQLGLWEEYGYIDLAENHLNDALADFRKEVQLHPQYERGYQGLVTAQLRLNQKSDAEHTLRQSLQVFPDDAPTILRLNFVLMQQKKYDEAVALLLPAQKALPNDTSIALQAGRAQILSGKRSDGEATLRTALSATDDPGILNDAAYELADASLDLDLAETSCRKALRLLDKEASQLSLNNLNSSDLLRLQLLSAAWDTMGWIYFRKGDLALAESYVRASWFESQHRDVGDHLGQIYEAQGRKQEAANIYALAAASSRTPNADHDELEKRMAALKEHGVRTTYHDPSHELGEQRSVYLPKLSKKYVTAEFFVEFSPGKVNNVQFIRGDEVLRQAGDTLLKTEFQVPFPRDSQAKLIRRGILACAESDNKCMFTLLLPQSTTLD